MAVLWPDGSAKQSPPRVSSEFNMNRRNPVTGVVQPHWGIDLVGWRYIKAGGNGVVTFSGYNGGAGYEVRIRLDNGDVTRDLHNSELWVRTGQRVTQGQTVAIMGTTGQSTGIHCHHETRPGGGQAINPRDYHWVKNKPAAPAGGGGGPKVPTEEEELMAAKDDINKHVTAEISRAISAVVREHRLRKFVSDDGKYAALGRFGQVIKLSSNPTIAKAEMENYSRVQPLLFPADELKSDVKLSSAAFFSLVDRFDPTGRHGYGQFIKNTFELNSGSTRQVRTDVVLNYPDRNTVWADGRPVEITLGGKVIVDFFTNAGVKSARFADGTTSPLNATQVARANAQVAGNSQNWS